MKDSYFYYVFKLTNFAKGKTTESFDIFHGSLSDLMISSQDQDEHCIITYIKEITKDDYDAMLASDFF